MPASTHELELRIARLEEALAVRTSQQQTLSRAGFFASLSLLSAGLAAAYFGVGLPNHPYQWALGALTTALAYHRRWFRRPRKTYEWILAPLNAALIAMLFKLLIGSGVHHPLGWLRIPELVNTSSSLVPNWSLVWQPVGLSAWEIDLTLIQSFLLLVTLIGALFRFQPFVSFTAFALILFSLPAFTSFNWTWVFPAMAVAAVAFYVQGAAA